MVVGKSVQVAIEGAPEITAHGIASMLQGADPRITVVDSQTQGLIGVDVTLIDTFFTSRQEIDAVADAVADPLAGAVALLVWDITPVSLNIAIHLGCRGCIAKTSSTPELVTAIRAIHEGHIHIPQAFDRSTELAETGFPSYSSGLTQREAQIITMIAHGYTNAEIAQAYYLSVNTVKSYIRTAYRKMGVQRRPDAVRWGIERGFYPHTPEYLAATTPQPTPVAMTQLQQKSPLPL